MLVQDPSTERPAIDLEALFTHLDSWDCDDTLDLTRQWLTEQGYPVSESVAWIGEHLGESDCEVLLALAYALGG